MKKISVKLKITLWYTVAMLILASVVLFAMSSVGKGFIKRDIEQSIVRVVTDGARMLSAPDADARIRNFRFFDRGVHMALYDAYGNILAGNIPFDFDENISFYDARLLLHDEGVESYYIRDNKVYMPGGYLWLRGVVSVSDHSKGIDSATRLNMIFVLIMIIIASMGGYFLIGRILVPVEKIRQTAKTISESEDFSKRINLGSGNDEIYALANTFDQMLAKLEETLEREKQFTSDASHELRTPVAVILSECEYMKTCAKSIQDYAESVDSVQRQAEKMKKLIRELLTISRMDKNTLQMSFEQTDISELLEFICDEQEEIQTGDVKMIRNITPSIEAIVDKFLIARVLINLISNAYRYNKPEGTVWVSLTKEEDNIVFSVADSGIGIKEEDMPKIWERFYQVDPSRTANDNGSMGLGLSMVKWIAQCHKGEISVISEYGKGSEFRFVLPVGDEEKVEK